MDRRDVVILGAGAAGLMCAVEAARRGRRVLVIDHAKAAGEKIRISGGGRCNFTNTGIEADRFLSENPRFALSALKRFSQWDFVARIDRAGIAWHEKTLGQLFCDGSATQVTAMFLRDLANARGEIWVGCALGEVTTLNDGGYRVETARGPVQAGSVVVATGGKSIPKMGASGYGYQVAQAFGLPIVETRPALVPLTFGPQDLSWMAGLAGVAVPVEARAGRGRFAEALLFTHRGLSGPAILQVSSYWREGEAIHLTLCPEADIRKAVAEMRATSGKTGLRAVLGRFMPDRLARHLALEIGAEKTVAGLSKAELVALEKRLSDWRLVPTGSEGYRTAEVTLGGVSTVALDPRRMEVRGRPGLFFIGEVVDVTGWLGGYNFQWAWSSGWVAGQVA